MQNLTLDPLEVFRSWYERAERKSFAKTLLTRLYPPAVIHQPDAMTLATADIDGKPSARVVLFKGIEEGGFTFYTNYLSRKGNELEANPRAAAVFHWAFPERQVRIEGVIRKLSREQSVAYWMSRPRGSQLGAAASVQSAGMESRQDLIARVEELKRKYMDQEVPCPEHWGGYCLTPERIEFWEGRVNRLHERTLFTKEGTRWSKRLLAP